MGLGETSGIRALVDVLRTRDYCISRGQAGFTAEQFSDIKASELDTLTQTADTAASKAQTSRYRLELADVYALRRDLRYSMRSRRFLFAKAQQTRLDAGFAGFRAFGMENLDHKNYISGLTTKSALELKALDFNTLEKGG